MPLILIVDDSPTEVHVMQKALEKHGYRTAAAADGAEKQGRSRLLHFSHRAMIDSHRGHF